MPHLLFYGPPGTGKTSTILAVCRELYGPLMKERVKELNASDERGIKIVRGKIKTFAMAKVGKKKVDGFPCPPFKLIILDECDSMTDTAQAALRRTIEQYSHTTRFCLICNYVSRIIDPLASRCAKFRFKPLSNEAMLGRLREVAAAEQLTLVDDCEAALLKTSGGDMRKAITYLQSASQLYGEDGNVSGDAVLQISGSLPTDVSNQFWEACHEKKFNRIQSEIDNIVAEGFAATAILQRFLEDTLKDERMDDAQKSIVLIKIAEADKCLCDGADEELQLLNVGAHILAALQKSELP
jgi:replication factor C subunit 2/4